MEKIPQPTATASLPAPRLTGALIGMDSNVTPGGAGMMRVPYPLGFFSRSAVGRIHDAKSGWKGKALWTNYSNYAGWHVEGGKGARPKAVKIQVRPDPIAK